MTLVESPKVDHTQYVYLQQQMVDLQITMDKVNARLQQDIDNITIYNTPLDEKKISFYNKHN